MRRQASPLWHFNATSASCPSHSPSLYQRLMPTMSRLRKTPRFGFPALQHLQALTPFLSRNRLIPRPIGFTLPTGSPALRVWLPSRRRQLSRPSEASFSSPRSWAYPFRALLLFGDQDPVSRTSSAPALPCKTCSALHRRSSGFIPPKKPSPFAPPECLTRAGSSCSPGFSTSRASPSAEPIEELLPLQSPSCPLKTKTLRPRFPGTPGFFFQRLGSLPPKRAPARLAFLTCRIRYPFERWTRRGLFFQLQVPASLPKNQPPVSTADPRPPNGR
jgi:hypothetical protein